jgi:mono/diheme cytochrome c family protein
MKKLLSIVIPLTLAACGGQDHPSATQTTTTNQLGKSLFMQNCASCHTPKKDFVGPALAGVEQRWSDKQQLYALIKNAPQVIKENKYANDLWLKYNKSLMQPFPNLKDEEIDEILKYINEPAP